MIPSFRAILPRPPNFGTLRLFAGSVRAVSSHAALTQLLLPVSDGVEEDAERELRWMKEEIQRIQHINRNLSEPEQHSRLEEMVRERAQGKPLQYVLGELDTVLVPPRFSEPLVPSDHLPTCLKLNLAHPALLFSSLPGTHPFGPLLLAVRPPILIPRPETEEWAIHLASLLHPTPSTPPGRRLRILDLCTGTGCIPLLLCASLPAGTVQARGVDILPEAVELARENASLLEKEANTFEVIQRDVFSEGSLEEMMGQGGWVNPDVLTSNPPYIPRDEMLKLDKSVSEYESHLALAGDVPESFSPSVRPVPYHPST